MKNDEGEAVNERLLAKLVTDVQPKPECPDDLALLLARLEPNRQRKIQHAAQLDEWLIECMQSMPDSERGKFKRLLRNIELLGDVEKAAQKARVSRKLFDKWRKTHALCWGVAKALGTYSEVHDEGILFLAKRSRYLEDAWGYAWAKLAAQNLKASAELIHLAAQQDAKKFFIALGKYLSSELKSTLHDKMDLDLADILSENPSISGKEAVRELKKRGHSYHLSEENFRERKYRLLRAAYKALQSD
jgi:hypothetical protein